MAEGTVSTTPTSFRSASVSAGSEVSVPATATPAHTSTPISIYKEYEGRPYSADFFDVKDIWDNEESGMRDELNDIDNYYRHLVVNNKIEDGEKSYSNMIKNIEKMLDIPKDSPRGIRIMKVAEFVRSLIKIDNMDSNFLKMNI